jgi:hypothetical protein
MEMVYHYSGSEYDTEDSMPLFNQLQVWLHSFFCSDCAEKIECFEFARSILREDFFPQAPNLENAIMAKIAHEPESETAPFTAGGLSTRGWIITGLIMLISLATAFFGLDFQNLASETGTSFLLPVGITIGILLSVYGVFFIGSHLKELTERFGL